MMYHSFCGSGPTEDLVWQPEERVAECVKFVLNNLQQSNVVEKANELRKTVDFNSHFCRWFAKQLLVARISSQPNFMSTYYHLLVALKSDELEKHMRDETFRQIRRLLTENASKTPADRQALKLMGTWLGFLTLARNKPLSYRDLNLGEILKVAQELGDEELAYVVPLVTKMLRASRMSSICGPESAYTKSLLNLLVSLHKVQKLKLNVKFEIEILFRDLGIGLDGLKSQETPLIFARALRIPIVAAEKILTVHQIPAAIPSPIGGIDEDLIMRLNGFVFEIPPKEYVCEVLAATGVQQKEPEPRQVQYQHHQPPPAVPVQQQSQQPPMTFEIAAPQPLPQPPPEQFADPRDIAQTVEALFRNLHANYYSKVGLLNQESGVAFIFEKVKVKNFLYSKSAYHFISLTLRGAVYICYDMERMDALVSRRDFCIYLLDNVAVLIVMALDYYNELEMKYHSFRVLLSVVVDIITNDLYTNGYRNFSAFPYFRVILAVMWNLMKKHNGESIFLCNLNQYFFWAMEALQPSKNSACAFDWLNVIGETEVMLGLVMNPANKYQSRESYVELLLFALKFLDPFYSRVLVVTDAVQKFYHGITRLFLFLSVNTDVIHEYHTILISHIPSACTQLLSIVLSTAPAPTNLRSAAPGQRWMAESAMAAKYHYHQPMKIPGMAAIGAGHF